MAGELEEAVCVACEADAFDDFVLVLLRGTWSKEGADVDDGDDGFFFAYATHFGMMKDN